MKTFSRLFIITALLFTIGAGAAVAPIFVSTTYATQGAGTGTTIKTPSSTSVKKTAPGISNGGKSVGPGKILGEILNFILQLFAWVVAAMGVLMGTTIYHTVLEAGSYVNKLGAVRTAWEMFRDLGNIILIFGFIAIGIATILDNASYGAKKALPKLLIVAIMLNFSLFAAEFIVDTGNMFATQFYTQINGGALPAGGISLSNEPISHILMNSLRLTTVYPTVGAPVTKNSSQHWFITFMLGIVLFIITAFVLGAVAIMLITRFIILVFLLIVSPIGFIGLAGIPLISSYGKKWWKALTDQTLLAPVLMLFLLVALKLIQSSTFKNTGSIAKATQQNNTTDIASVLLNFAIIIGLMLAALVISKSLSGKAASFAINTMSGGGRQIFGRQIFGGLGFVGRHTIGRGSQRLLEKLQGSNLASRHTLTSKFISSGLGFGASASFDARNIIKKTGLNAGKASGGGGYRKSYEKKVRDNEQGAADAGRLTLRERQELAAAKEHEKAAGKNFKDAQKDQKSDLSFIDDQHSTARSASERHVDDAQKAYDKANGDQIETPFRQENLAKLKKTLDEEKKLHNEKLDEQKKELDDIKEAHAKETAARTEELGAATEHVNKIKNAGRVRQEQFADDITSGLGGAFKSNQVAQQNILDSLAKSSDQKQMDALLKALKTANEKPAEKDS